MSCAASAGGWVGSAGPPTRSSAPTSGLMDVGLIAYTESELNQLTFPRKTLDYLAAGRPVVSTDLLGPLAPGSPAVERRRARAR